jgi:hypothetical protein
MIVSFCLILHLVTLIGNANAIIAGQTKFLSKVWDAQTRPAPQSSVVTIDPSISPEIFSEVVQHLEYCSRVEGFGETSVLVGAAGHAGEELLFPGFSPEGAQGKEKVVYSAIDEEVLRDSMLWCRAMISDFSVCPFTIDEVEAGIPKGKIRYTMSSATTVEESFRDFWLEMTAVLENTNEDVATVLLMYGEKNLFLHDIELFEAFTACLDDCLKHKSLGIEEQMQLVYFHPEFKFRDKDGQNQILFADDGSPLGMSSDIVNPIDYSRRSPYPTINILRAPQVNKVQKGVPLGQIFQNNVENLNTIGTQRLEAMLKARDWSDLPVISSHAKRRHKVGTATGTATASGLSSSRHSTVSSLDEQEQVEAVVEYLAQSERARVEGSTDSGDSDVFAEEEEEWTARSQAEGWVEYRTGEGRPYYHNPETGEVTWSLPLTQEREQEQEQEEDLRWEEHRTEDGVPYYYSPVLGESRWQAP